MKAVFAAASVLVLAAPAMAAPGDPHTLRGNLEWPATLSAEPFIIVRGDDGRVYYADVSTAKRMSTGAIAGPISLVGIEGNQPHEIAAVVVGAGDSAFAFMTPSVPPPAQIAPAPSSLPRDMATPTPPGAAPPPPSVSVPPATAPPTPPTAPQVAAVAPESSGEDLWRIQGKVTAVSPSEFVVETSGGETVH